jgi:hypothetical protein
MGVPKLSDAGVRDGVRYWRVGQAGVLSEPELVAGLKTAAKENAKERRDAEAADTAVAVQAVEESFGGRPVGGADVVVAAEKILAAKGTTNPTEEELLEAMVEAQASVAPDETEPDQEPVEVDAAAVHARAVKILVDSGRELTHTQDEFVSAFERAERELTAAGAR